MLDMSYTTLNVTGDITASILLTKGDVKMNEVVKILAELKKTIATMESCSGGAVVNAITNIPGASRVLKFSAVTYANEFKIKMGVDKELLINIVFIVWKLQKI